MENYELFSLVSDYLYQMYYNTNKGVDKNILKIGGYILCTA